MHSYPNFDAARGTRHPGDLPLIVLTSQDNVIGGDSTSPRRKLPH
jgi:hypothetical protein